MRGAWAEIDIAALNRNVQRLQERAPASQILAILKANAYGHGLIEIAKHIQGVGAIGVARVGEAMRLRENGCQLPIVLLEGFFSATELPLLAEYQLQPVIHQQQQLQQFLGYRFNTNIPVWLKVDSGMHRIGLDPEFAAQAYQSLCEHPDVAEAPVIMSHFACADEANHPLNMKQQQVMQTLASLSPVRSFANSAAIVNFPAWQQQWVRPGLLMYGVSPIRSESSESLGVTPVMTLKASIISVRSVKQGESVGYGSAWTASRDTQVGIVAIGYGDGYPRHAPNGTPVLINGHRYGLAGRVSMDMLAVELGPGSAVKVGDTAILWGKDEASQQQLSVDDIAAAAGTISYELLCNMAQRVEYDYALSKQISM
ncbi:alanine racemase [Idiomarina tyrosinivorans]|uniref:Alanine racemase n=1 Tax=Idiomarina tyrosinivorans TaxID=1445662 RepID=A0A432ZG60_9GAMM|nr:alanine racemase [Idiomarina tyrosinivorans]RUO76894.1 alanine racemase [Idiomarina tyrosinivorans]